MKLIVKNLSGERAGQIIFSDLSFALGDGEALIITGVNGSGKSTMLRIICGLLPARRGTIKIDGGGNETVAELIHYVGHLNALKPALSIEENLTFWKQFCGNGMLSPEDALAAVDLAGIGHLPAGYLSAGQKRRVSIAKLLVSYKPIWVVDEPTAALDKASEAMFGALVDDHLAKGGIALAATHKPLGMRQSQMLDMDEFSKTSLQQDYNDEMML